MASVTESHSGGLVPRDLFFPTKPSTLSSITSAFSSLSVKLSNSPHILSILARVANDPNFLPMKVYTMEEIMMTMPFIDTIQHKAEAIWKYAAEWNFDATDEKTVEEKVEELSWAVSVIYGAGGSQPGKDFSADFFLYVFMFWLRSLGLTDRRRWQNAPRDLVHLHPVVHGLSLSVVPLDPAPDALRAGPLDLCCPRPTASVHLALLLQLVRDPHSAGSHGDPPPGHAGQSARESEPLVPAAANDAGPSKRASAQDPTDVCVLGGEVRGKAGRVFRGYERECRAEVGRVGAFGRIVLHTGCGLDGEAVGLDQRGRGERRLGFRRSRGP